MRTDSSNGASGVAAISWPTCARASRVLLSNAEGSCS
jgi:hypothetical protein